MVFLEIAFPKIEPKILPKPLKVCILQKRIIFGRPSARVFIKNSFRHSNFQLFYALVRNTKELLLMPQFLYFKVTLINLLRSNTHKKDFFTHYKIITEMQPVGGESEIYNLHRSNFRYGARSKFKQQGIFQKGNA